MRIFLYLLLIVIIAFAAAPFLIPPVDNVRPVEGLPWQIEPLEDGSAKVFGLTLGRDRLSNAREKLGPDMELAIVTAGDEPGSLEMFYSNYAAGPLNGKLVLTGMLEDSTIAKLRARSGAPRYLDSGARKYHLRKEDLSLAYNAPIQSITFIPTARLNEEIARKRFGRPEQTIRIDGETLHLLYPQFGVDLMLSQDHKDVLQYVAPRNFEQLRVPLLRAATTPSGNPVRPSR
jgi:hypothetical protein